MNDMQQEMIKMWRTSWESCVKTAKMVQDQSEKMLELYVSQGEAIQEESKNLLKEGIKAAKDAQETYLKTVEENLKKFEETATAQPV